MNGSDRDNGSSRATGGDMDSGDGRRPSPDDVDPGDDGATLASATGSFYRATVDRTTTWRTRLDQTTNWAVVVLAAVLTWAFSSASNPHYVVLVGGFVVTAFLVVEAHRYQEYDVWRTRVRLLERNFYANVYDPGAEVDADWRAKLGGDLRTPRLHVTLLSALAHRLRRVYVFLLTIVLLAWGLRITVFEGATTWRQTAAIGPIPGTIVVGIVVGAYLLVVLVTLWSLRGSTVREFQGDDET